MFVERMHEKCREGRSASEKYLQFTRLVYVHACTEELECDTCALTTGTSYAGVGLPVQMFLINNLNFQSVVSGPSRAFPARLCRIRTISKLLAVFPSFAERPGVLPVLLATVHATLTPPGALTPFPVLTHGAAVPRRPASYCGLPFWLLHATLGS